MLRQVIIADEGRKNTLISASDTVLMSKRDDAFIAVRPGPPPFRTSPVSFVLKCRLVGLSDRDEGSASGDCGTGNQKIARALGGWHKLSRFGSFVMAPLFFAHPLRSASDVCGGSRRIIRWKIESNLA